MAWQLRIFCWKCEDFESISHER